MVYGKEVEAGLLMQQLGITGGANDLESLGYKWDEDQQAWLDRDGMLALTEHVTHLTHLTEVYA